jgi:hypothetical protein
MLARPLAAAALVSVAGAQAVNPAPTLPAAPGWRAELIHKSDAGVWYAHIDKVVDWYGANEVIAGDDKGRLLLLSVYSAQWTPQSVVCDGQWLAPTRSVDVDPRVAGREIYAGGRSGTIHRVVLRPQPFAKVSLESREIGHAAGEEFHALIAGDLAPGGQDELLAFGITGAVFQLVPEGAGDAFAMRRVATVPGRVRDVAVVPGAAGQPATLFAVSRSGDLIEARLAGDSLQHRTVLHEDCGLGRVALAKGRAGVLYVTRDDGVVVRVQPGAEGTASREVVFAGGQGLRGVASGRFFADDREAVAVCGYDQVVHLITRAQPDGWRVETVFASAQRGHWLAVGELDGRNGTDELVATGFDGEVVLLSRPAGYGLPGAAVPEKERATTSPPAPSPEAKEKQQVPQRVTGQ